MVPPVRERGVRLHRIQVAEACSKPPSRLRRGGGLLSPRPRSQRLQARTISLLQALLLPKPAILSLQQPLLCAPGPSPFRLLRLQFLHAPLQAIDAPLPVFALA